MKGRLSSGCGVVMDEVVGGRSVVSVLLRQVGRGKRLVEAAGHGRRDWAFARVGGDRVGVVGRGFGGVVDEHAAVRFLAADLAEYLLATQGAETGEIVFKRNKVGATNRWILGDVLGDARRVTNQVGHFRSRDAGGWRVHMVLARLAGVHEGVRFLVFLWMQEVGATREKVSERDREKDAWKGEE